MLAQSDICGFEVIQPVSAWLVKAERVGAGRARMGGQNSCRAAAGSAPTSSVPNRGGVIVYSARHRAGKQNFCLADKIFFTFQLTTDIYFLKEDYYVREKICKSLTLFGGST